MVQPKYLFCIVKRFDVKTLTVFQTMNKDLMAEGGPWRRGFSIFTPGGELRYYLWYQYVPKPVINPNPAPNRQPRH